jgi:hypothetical protein
MSEAKSYKGLLKVYAEQPNQVRIYFDAFPLLVSADIPLEVALSYLFSRVERAHRRSLYCGVCKNYGGNSELVGKIVHQEFMTRDRFKTLFKAVLKTDFPNSLSDLIEHAEKTRDMFLHGRDQKPSNARQAIIDVFDYAAEFNKTVFDAAGFKPFGDLRGFKGRGENLNMDTTKWILKGIGFSIQG